MQQYMNVMGKLVKDKVTGFTGICVSVSFDLYGCVQCVVNPQTKAESTDKVEDGRWFDHKRLMILDNTPVMEVPDYGSIVTTPKQAIGPEIKPAGRRNT